MFLNRNIMLMSPIVQICHVAPIDLCGYVKYHVKLHNASMYIFSNDIYTEIISSKWIEQKASNWLRHTFTKFLVEYVHRKW